MHARAPRDPPPPPPPQDEVPAVFSLTQRLGLVPPPEWLAAMTAAAMDLLGNRERNLRAAEFRRLLVGLAGSGWRPEPAQLELIVDRSFPQLSAGYCNVNDLVEIAWALAQWETPMPPNWAKVRARPHPSRTRTCACRHAGTRLCVLCVRASLADAVCASPRRACAVRARRCSTAR